MPRGDLKLVTHPEKHPAVDFITRSGAGPFVDTGVDVMMQPQPGMQFVSERVYLSVNTIRQLAQVAGIKSEQGVSAEREAQLIAQGKLEGLKEDLGGDLEHVARTLGQWLDAAGIGGNSDSRS